MRMISSFSSGCDVLPIAITLFEQAVLEGDLGQCLLELAASARSVLTSSDVASRAVSPASRFLPAKELLGPAVIKILGDALLRPRRCCPHRASLRDDADLLLSGELRLVALRMSLTVSSALCGACLSRCLIVSILGVTMSPNSLLCNQLKLSGILTGLA